MVKQASNKSPQIRFKGHTANWKTERVSSLLTERDIQAPKSELYPLMAFIAGQGVAPKGSRYNREFLVSDEINKKYKQTEYGDFIYSSNNLETGSIGNNYYGKASISPVYSVFAPSTEGDSNFIGQLLSKRSFINEMVKWRQGVVYGQWRIHEEDFLKIDVTFPTYGEQKEIGGLLRKLDELIALHRNKHDRLAALKRSLLRKIFPQPNSLVPELRFRGFSGNWEEKRFGDVAALINGRAYSQNELLDSGRYRVLRVGNLYTNSSWYYSNLDLADKYYANNGDLLYAWSASFGPHIWSAEKVIYHYHIWKIELSDALEKPFTLQLLENDKERILANSNGSTMVHITKEGMEDKIIVVPHPDEQEKIGLYFRSLDELIAQHANQLKKLLQVKIALLEKMFP